MGFTNQLQNFKGTDEYYTPLHAVEILLPYIPEHSKIWCPFDKEFSQYVQVFTAGGHEVVYSHIDNGQDFFRYEPDQEYDFIISNPPYSKKDAVIKRLYELGHPWSMFLNPNGIFDARERFNFFSRFGVQLLIPRGRTQFMKYGSELCTSPPFLTVYVCWRFLPETIMFEQDDKQINLF